MGIPLISLAVFSSSSSFFVTFKFEYFFFRKEAISNLFNLSINEIQIIHSSSLQQHHHRIRQLSRMDLVLQICHK